MKIGFIGLGNVGSKLAGSLLRNKFDLMVRDLDKDLINFRMLNKVEKNYLFKYNLEIYEKISKFLNKKEKNWLLNFI